MNVTELITQLQDVLDEHGDIEVRLAHQPEWAFEYDIANVVVADANGEEDGDEPVDRIPANDVDEEMVCYIAEGEQIGYLGGVATKECWH